MLTNDLVPCFVQSFKTDSKTGYEKALLVGVFDKTTTDLDCCISSSSRDTGKTRQPVAVVMCKDGRLGCGARTDLEYAEEFAVDLWNERVSHVE